MEDFIKLLPLQKKGNYRPEPQLCNCAFGDSKCIKRNYKKECPSNLEHTNVCGGWQPRSGLPKRNRVFKEAV
jgi:hypothetical protein